MSRVNADNYIEMAKQYGRSIGRGKDAAWPVVRVGTPEWEAWMTYFEIIGHPHGGPNSFARKHGVLTVPSVWPHQFDQSWRSDAAE
jgi:hypothetical protein